MKEQRNTYIENLTAKQLLGNISEEEKALLDKLIRDTDNGEKLYKDYQKIYRASKITTPRQIDVDDEWNVFVKNAQSLKPKRKTSNRWMAVAASLVFLLGIAYMINHITTNRLMEYSTTSEVLDVVLPDGSSVTLNKHSTLSYHPSYGETERSLSITGEAFFDVERNEQKPFMVQVGNTYVKVLGTSFNIDAENDITVTVATGTVEFSNTNEHVTLTQGETGIFDKSSNTIVEFVNEDTNYLAWKTKRLTYKSSKLDDVLTDLEHIYDVNFQLETDISACMISVNFDNQSLESILTILKEVANLSYLKEGNTIRITNAGC